jgi:hypothetical protein
MAKFANAPDTCKMILNLGMCSTGFASNKEISVPKVLELGRN